MGGEQLELEREAPSQQAGDQSGGGGEEQVGLTLPPPRWLVWRPLTLGGLAVCAAAVASALGDMRSHHLAEKLIPVGGAVAFIVLACTATLGVAGQARDLSRNRIGEPHAAVLRLAIVLVGGFTTLLVTLGLLSVPISQLVLGGAVTGVVLGIAGQQTLANLFAGIVLLIARPFAVGDEVRLRSGPLGGMVDGRVLEVGLAYTRMDTAEGVLSIPNSQVLNSAVGPRPPDGGGEAQI